MDKYTPNFDLLADVQALLARRDRPTSHFTRASSYTSNKSSLNEPKHSLDTKCATKCQNAKFNLDTNVYNGRNAKLQQEIEEQLEMFWNTFKLHTNYYFLSRLDETPKHYLSVTFVCKQTPPLPQLVQSPSNASDVNPHKMKIHTHNTKSTKLQSASSDCTALTSNSTLFAAKQSRTVLNEADTTIPIKENLSATIDNSDDTSVTNNNDTIRKYVYFGENPTSLQRKSLLAQGACCKVHPFSEWQETLVTHCNMNNNTIAKDTSETEPSNAKVRQTCIEYVHKNIMKTFPDATEISIRYEGYYMTTTLTEFRLNDPACIRTMLTDDLNNMNDTLVCDIETNRNESQKVHPHHTLDVQMSQVEHTVDVQTSQAEHTLDTQMSQVEHTLDTKMSQASPAEHTLDTKMSQTSQAEHTLDTQMSEAHLKSSTQTSQPHLRSSTVRELDRLDTLCMLTILDQSETKSTLNHDAASKAGGSLMAEYVHLPLFLNSKGNIMYQDALIDCLSTVKHTSIPSILIHRGASQLRELCPRPESIWLNMKDKAHDVSLGSTSCFSRSKDSKKTKRCLHELLACIKPRIQSWQQSHCKFEQN